MTRVATTRLSSTGQVVIPELIREQLHLRPGMEFIVVSENDVILLKAVQAPSLKGFESLIRKTRIQARRAGVKPRDVKAAIQKVRE